MSEVATAREPTLAQLARYFLRLGALGFGGPIALAGYMQRDLVERRGWIAPDDFKQGLALAQLAPGPLAAQLAIYLGWVRGRILGATVVAIAFVLPSFLMVLCLSALYVHAGGLAWMQGLFYGVGAAVIAIIARSAVKLGALTLGRRWLLWAIAAANAAVVALTEQEIIWLFLASGVVVLAVEWPRARAAMIVPPWLFAGIGGIATGGTLLTLFLFFAQAGAVVFGSGLAIVPFLHGGVVEQHHWLTDQQFLDAVAIAMISPGPVVITVAFIGYLVAGPVGATVAAAGVFLPCWLFVIVPAPYFRRFADDRRVRAFVDGVTAAAAGAIGGAAVVLGRRAIVDVPTALIGLGALAVITRIKKVPEPLVILAAGAVGLAVWSAT
ncbi:MAG: chromate transporter [Deltaproteobacteria bacterium]|nr:chromate transporter [Deltaproteobacteria bacterium]